MNAAFTLIRIAGIITGFCILSCIAYFSYKISEACKGSSLMDAPFPPVMKNAGKKDLKRYNDYYSRSSSNARAAMGCIYSAGELETVRRKYAPQKLPKGRYNV